MNANPRQLSYLRVRTVSADHQFCGKTLAIRQLQLMSIIVAMQRNQ